MDRLGREAAAVVEEFRNTQVERARDPRYGLPAQTQFEVKQCAAATASGFESFLDKLSDDGMEKGFANEGADDDDISSSAMKQKLDEALAWLGKHMPKFAKNFAKNTKNAISMKLKQLGGSINLTRVFGFAMFASVTICFVEFMKYHREGMDWSEAMMKSMGTLLPSALTMSALGIFRKLSEPAVMKGIAQSMAIEMGEDFLSLITSSVITVIVTALWSVGRRLVVLFQRPQRPSFTEVLKEILLALGDSLQQTLPQVAVYAGIACFCPAWASLLLSFGLSVIFADIRETSRQRNEYFITTMAWYTIDIVLYIPRTVISTMFQVDRSECEDTRYPESLICPITMELLDDPVFFHGMVVSRSAAMSQIAVNGRDFWNVPLDMPEDPDRHLQAMPRLAEMVNRARLQTDSLLIR
jgi:hypothetical protein